MKNFVTRLKVMVLVACLAIPAAAFGNNANIPHITGNAGAWNNYLTVSNPSLDPAVFNVVVYDDGVVSGEKTFELPALGSLVVNLKEDLDADNAKGTGRVTSDSNNLVYRLTYESVPASGLAQFAINPLGYKKLAFYFTNINPILVWQAIAVNNLGNDPAEVTLYAVGQEEILGIATETIAGNSKVDGVAEVWFPDVPFGDIDYIVAVSENDLTGITISGSADNGTLLFMPAAGAEGFEPPPADNIVETLIANGSFDTLVAALQAAELDDDLAGSGPFTVFAPTDDAFDLLPEGTLDFLLDPANKDTLIDLLTYHVFNGSVLASDAIDLDGQSVAMLNGKTMSIDLVTDDLVLNLGGNRPATVTLTDVLCSNGVIHGIDAVLDPDDAGDAGEGGDVE